MQRFGEVQDGPGYVLFGGGRVVVWRCPALVEGWALGVADIGGVVYGREEVQDVVLALGGGGGEGVV